MEIRTFNTGATRNVDENKYDYEGFLSPIALKAFAKYMHDNRMQANGKLRDSDNWQKGIPLDSYMKSMYRHFFSVWENHRGVESDEDIATSLSALMFNVQGYLHEYLKKNTVSNIDTVSDTDVYLDRIANHSMLTITEKHFMFEILNSPIKDSEKYNIIDNMIKSKDWTYKRIQTGEMDGEPITREMTTQEKRELQDDYDKLNSPVKDEEKINTVKKVIDNSDITTGVKYPNDCDDYSWIKSRIKTGDWDGEPITRPKTLSERYD